MKRGLVNGAFIIVIVLSFFILAKFFLLSELIPDIFAQMNDPDTCPHGGCEVYLVFPPQDPTDGLKGQYPFQVSIIPNDLDGMVYLKVFHQAQDGSFEELVIDESGFGACILQKNMDSGDFEGRCDTLSFENIDDIYFQPRFYRGGSIEELLRGPDAPNPGSPDENPMFGLFSINNDFSLSIPGDADLTGIYTVSGEGDWQAAFSGNVYNAIVNLVSQENTTDSYQIYLQRIEGSDSNSFWSTVWDSALAPDGPYIASLDYLSVHGVPHTGVIVYDVNIVNNFNEPPPLPPCQIEDYICNQWELNCPSSGVQICIDQVLDNPDCIPPDNPPQLTRPCDYCEVEGDPVCNWPNECPSGETQWIDCVDNCGSIVQQSRYCDSECDATIWTCQEPAICPLDTSQPMICVNDCGDTTEGELVDCPTSEGLSDDTNVNINTNTAVTNTNTSTFVNTNTAVTNTNTSTFVNTNISNINSNVSGDTISEDIENVYQTENRPEIRMKSVKVDSDDPTLFHLSAEIVAGEVNNLDFKYRSKDENQEAGEPLFISRGILESSDPQIWVAEWKPERGIIGRFVVYAEAGITRAGREIIIRSSDAIPVLLGMNLAVESPQENPELDKDSPILIVGNPKEEGRLAPDVLKIESIENYAPEIDENNLVIKGKGPPNTKVYIWFYSDPLVIETTTDENGNFIYTLKKDLIDGKHEVYVTVNDATGKIQEKSSPFTFFVRRARAVTEDEYLRGDVNVDTERTAVVNNFVIPAAIIVVVFLLIVVGAFVVNRKSNVT